MEYAIFGVCIRKGVVFIQIKMIYPKVVVLKSLAMLMSMCKIISQQSWECKQFSAQENTLDYRQWLAEVRKRRFNLSKIGYGRRLIPGVANAYQKPGER
jgi:hypothetical protein